LNDSACYYDEQRKGLGTEFRIEVYDAIKRIHDNPLLYPEANGIRRALVKRFPYSVVYRIKENQVIRILLIRHHKQHPKYGSSRR
jgi:plasmid stabilization system protein ParE